MSNQSTKQQETPNLFPAGRLAATGNGDKYNEPLAVAEKANNSFLESLFPKHALEASKVSQSVLITSNASSISWSGALLDAHQVPGSPTLLVGVPVAEGVEIREHVEILLDLASDSLNCSTLVFVLDKSSPDLRELVHGLLFIGGTIVRPDARNGWKWEVDKGKVLIGMEL